MYAQLWEEDRQAKCHREEMEAALQIERNREMLQVLTLQKSAIDKQKEEMLQLREQEAELLVHTDTELLQCMYYITYIRTYMYIGTHFNVYFVVF